MTVPIDRTLYCGDIGSFGAYRALDREHLPGGEFQLPVFVLPRAPVVVKAVQAKTTVLADSSCAILYNQGEQVEVAYVEGIDRCDYFSLWPGVMAEVSGSLTTPGTEAQRPFRRLDVPVSAAQVVAVRRMVSRLLTGDVERLEVEEMMLTMAGAFLKIGSSPRPEYGRQETRKGHRHLIASVKELIASDISSSADLTELGKQVGASPYHLSRIFKSVTGYTISGYRNSIRLRAALDALDTNDLSDRAIAHGFSSHSHFTAAFKKEFGLTPSRARELLGTGREPF